MKKAMSVALVLLLLFSAAACGSKDEDPVKEDETPPAVVPTQEVDVLPTPGPMDWWHGSWYGYWMVADISEDYEIPEGYKWDCYAMSQVWMDDISVFTIWDDGMELGSVTLRLDPAGGIGDRGSATAEGGALLESAIEDGDWTIDPELSPYENQIIINWRAEFDDGGYEEYQLVLRPWGVLWDDVPEDERPPYYDWYLGLREGPLSDVPFHFH